MTCLISVEISKTDLKMNLSQFDSGYLFICHVNIINFPSTRETVLVDAGAKHGTEVDSRGNSELEEGRLQNLCLGA